VSDKREVTMARDTRVTADVLLSDVEQQKFDAIVLPGGMPGATHLRNSEGLASMLKAQNDRGDIIGAICASPAVVLEPIGVLNGKKAACYPVKTFQKQIEKHAVASDMNTEPVIVSKNIVTSRGPGTAFSFALTLLEELSGEKQAKSVADGLLLTHRSAPRV
jgi:4-methyl-5(b-hydroxyethyl)-thiazole monophosphate biosynthesis